MKLLYVNEATRVGEPVDNQRKSSVSSGRETYHREKCWNTWRAAAPRRITCGRLSTSCGVQITCGRRPTACRSARPTTMPVAGCWRLWLTTTSWWRLTATRRGRGTRRPLPWNCPVSTNSSNTSFSNRIYTFRWWIHRNRRWVRRPAPVRARRAIRPKPRWHYRTTTRYRWTWAPMVRFVRRSTCLTDPWPHMDTTPYSPTGTFTH